MTSHRYPGNANLSDSYRAVTILLVDISAVLYINKTRIIDRLIYILYTALYETEILVKVSRTGP